MRRLLMVATVITQTLASSCSMAQATTPDPNNPAQCLVAFEYGHEMLRHASVPNLKGALSMTGRQIYYSQKMKASGVADLGATEATAFAKAHQGDGKLLQELLVRCIEVQDRDPNLLLSVPQLAPLVKRVDPICRENPSLCQ